MGKVDCKTLIIGAGFGGLCMGVQLRERGETDFIIAEKADEVGGTWRENTYPGAECDIASALYSYSFAPNPAWDFKWAKQPQIHAYQKGVAKDYGLYEHIQFGRTVVSAAFGDGVWATTFSDGAVIRSQFLVSAIGQLHLPKMPEIAGASEFQGASFHSAKWDHDYDYQGKRIAVIGNAASAIQLIPELAEATDNLTVYHRTPNWVFPKKDRAYTQFEKWLGKRVPVLGKLYRFNLFAQAEFFLWRIIKGKPISSWIGMKLSELHFKKHIKDPKLREALLPDYTMGARRVLISDKIYPALARENVENVVDGIDRMSEGGIISKDGTAREHDLIVYATGFYSNPFLKQIKVTGENGRVLSKHWEDGAHAYMGVMTEGFPNLFILYGPNTNTGHSSIIFKLENQVGYILQLMGKAEKQVVVKAEAESAFIDEMQSRLAELAWSKVEASWYKVGDKVPNNWPGSALEYKRRHKVPIWDHFEVS